LSLLKGNEFKLGSLARTFLMKTIF